MRISALKFGLAGGIVWGLVMFVMTVISHFTGYGMFWLAQWMDLYFGYDISLFGAVIGLLWGFVEGFLGLFLVAFVYNRL